MPTLTFKATEMKEAKVAHISLVDRSASRIPFKVVKQENPMTKLDKHFDLSSVFKREQPKPEPVQIVGVVTMKSDGFESVKTQFEASGVAIDKMTALNDGSVVFAQVDDVSGDSTVIRISDDAVIAVKGLKPYAMDMTMADGTTFEEVCKAQGFYPGVGSTLDILRESVLNAAAEAETPAEAATLVSKMFDEAKAYTLGMVKDLPAMAFKLEGVQAPEVEAPVVKADPVACNHCGAECGAEETVCKGCGKDPKGKKAMKADDTDPKPDPATVVTPAVPPVAGITADDVTKIVGDQMTSFTQKMEQLFSGVSKSVTDTTEAVTALGARVETAEAAAIAATKAIEGTVVLGGAGDAGDPVNAVQKRESRGGEIDTGFRAAGSRRAGR